MGSAKYVGWAAGPIEGNKCLGHVHVSRRLPREINDCAALIRFAYHQALREHDGAWASELDLDAIPNMASVLKFTYPRRPLRAGLFRVRPGPFIPANLTDGAFSAEPEPQKTTCD